MTQDEQLAVILARLDAMEQRLASLEHRLMPIAGAQPDRAKTARQEARARLLAIQQTPASVAAEAPVGQPLRPGETALAVEHEGVTAVVPTAVFHPVPVPTPAYRKPPVARQSLESKIGLNWTSWIGAIVLVLGMLFFMKYAWDQGWIRPSPAGRVIVTALLGVLLSGLGEGAFRRKMRTLAATLHGAGLAIVMAAVFGANTMFTPPVLDVGHAFAAVCVVAGIGVLLALRIDALTLAIIALLGAYLALAFLNTGEDKSINLLVFLGVLAGVGLLLSFFKRKWNSLRWFSFVMNGGWIALWFFGRFGVEHNTLAFAYALISFGGFIGQMIVSLHTLPAPEEGRPAGGHAVAYESSLGALSLFNTALTFGVLYVVMERMNAGAYTWTIALGLAGVHGVMLLASPSGLFARSSALQAAALVTLAIPLYFHAYAITLGWLVMGAALTAWGFYANTRTTRVWGTALFVLTVGRLLVIDRDDPHLSAAFLTVLDQPLTSWLLVMWVAGLLGYALAQLYQRAAQVIPAKKVSVSEPAIVLALAGTLVAMVANCFVFHAHAPLTLITVLWLLLIIVYAPFAQGMGYVMQAWLLAMAVSLKWFLVDGLVDISQAGTDISSALQHDLYVPFLNAFVLNGVLLAGAIIFLGRRKNIGPNAFSGTNTAAVGLGWAIVLLFALLNIEVCRTVDWLASSHDVPVLGSPWIMKNVALSVLWSITGFVAIVIGFGRKIALLRYTGLGLFAVTLAKILLVDMQNVTTVLRILSFLAVGALLMCVSLIYHRHAQKKEVAVPAQP